MRRGIILLVLAMVGLVACGDDALTETTPVEASSSTTDQAATTEAATTAAPRPPGPAFIMKGESGPYVRALQSYLDCAGYGPLAIDGVFGDGTAGAVSEAQADENKISNGEPDEETFAWLSRACFDDRVVGFSAGASSADVAGNAAPGDDDVLRIRVLAGQEMTVTVQGAVEIAIQGADGNVLHRPDGSAQVTVAIPSAQNYFIRVSAASPTSYLLTITVPPGPSPETTVPEAAEFLLAVDGFIEIDFGVETDEALEVLTSRFGSPDADTGWETVGESVFECGSVSRVVSWGFPAAGGYAATTLDVTFHDRNYSNPAFARWDYRLTDPEDGADAGPGALMTPHGLSVGDTYTDAVAQGFVLGGFEELSHGQIDGINLHVFSRVDDLDQDGYIGSMSAGTWVCENDV